MLKFLINIVEIFVISKITYRVVRYCVVRKFSNKSSKRKRDSDFKLARLFISNKIHYKLVDMLKEQKENLHIQDSPNIIPFKKYKRKIAK